MEKYIYLEKITKTRLIIGYILLFSGLLLIIFINIKIYPIYLLFWIALIIGGTITLTNEGIELDLKHNLYRNISSIFGIKLGSWKKFPEINYISIFRTNTTKTLGGIGLQSTATARITEKVILINLFTDNQKPTTLYTTKNKDLAVQICSKLKEKYGFEIVNKL